jgi:hypothetical protein
MAPLWSVVKFVSIRNCHNFKSRLEFFCLVRSSLRSPPMMISWVDSYVWKISNSWSIYSENSSYLSFSALVGSYTETSRIGLSIGMSTHWFLTPLYCTGFIYFEERSENFRVTYQLLCFFPQHRRCPIKTKAERCILLLFIAREV